MQFNSLRVPQNTPIIAIMNEEVFDVLRCWVIRVRGSLPTFRHILSCPFSRLKQSEKNSSSPAFLFKMGQTFFPEPSVAGNLLPTQGPQQTRKTKNPNYTAAEARNLAKLTKAKVVYVRLTMHPCIIFSNEAS